VETLSKLKETFKFETFKWRKSAQIETLFMTKTAEKPYPLAPHIPIRVSNGLSPPPSGLIAAAVINILKTCIL